MPNSRLTGSEGRRTRALLAGLCAAGLTAWSISHLAGLHFSSWGSLLVGSAVGVLLVFFAAFLGSLGINGTRNSPNPNPWRAALETGLIAVWLAPLGLLARQNSIWMLAVTGVLVAMAGIRIWPTRKTAEPASAQTDPAELFSLPQSPSWLHQASAFAAVVCAEAGAMAGASRHLFGGALLVVLASGVWLYTFREHWNSRSDEFHARQALTVTAIAIFFTVIGLLPFLRRGYATGSGAGRFTTQSRHVRSQTGARNAEDGYIAIELWPDQQPATLIAPSSFHKSSVGGKRSSPLVIPFSGVYWFFKSPDFSLPPKPREARGSPEMFDIHSTDHRSLSMQAHQNLGTLVDLACCRSIRIGIRNSDRYPGTVSIQLVLTDTTSPGRPAISLGRKLVRSTRPWMLYDHRPPTTEILEYAVPPNSRIHHFDEVMVIFWLDQDRSFAAAKMGIENFVLVPHGA